MEKIPARYKTKSKKSAPNAKAKTAKKRNNDGPTCSMFLAELTRKLASKKKIEDEAPRNIIHTIIDSITNALPIKLSKKSSPKCVPPTQIETLQIYAPELLPNNRLNILPVNNFSNELETEDIFKNESESVSHKLGVFHMPKMPVIDSDILKMAAKEKKMKIPMRDEEVNTSTEHDVATEIAKHVNTLRKISLIAEEFNQKTAKNLKEIVDSVQEDLIKKLEEIQTEQQRVVTQKPIDIHEEHLNSND